MIRQVMCEGSLIIIIIIISITISIIVIVIAIVIIIIINFIIININIGLTMMPWRAGRHLVWDATVVDTLAPSYVQASATMAGSAAEIATERKNSKYSELVNTHFFMPIALETLGPINVAGHNFLSELGRSLMLATGDNRETC